MRHIPIYRVNLVRDGTLVCDGEAGTNPAIQRTADAVAILKKELLGLDREKLVVLMLNARHRPIGLEVVAIGTLTASLAHPREIFKSAILRNAAGIILAHNHPSGDPAPSEEDNRLTKRLAQCGLHLGIELLDHVILAEEDCYSFRASGVL